MNYREHDPRHLAHSGSTKVQKKDSYSLKLSILIERLHSAQTLNIVSALSQVSLGSIVIVVSIMGLIQPLWVSAVMSMIASFATIIGIYKLYVLTFKPQSKDQLIREAMRRIMNAQN